MVEFFIDLPVDCRSNNADKHRTVPDYSWDQLRRSNSCHWNERASHRNNLRPLLLIVDAEEAPMVAATVVGEVELGGDVGVLIRRFNASAAVNPCWIFILNARLRSASSSTRSTDRFSIAVIQSLLGLTFDNGNIFIQSSDTIVECLLPVARLFMMHRPIKPFILAWIESRLKFQYEKKTRTARAIWADRSCTMNGCRKNSWKVMRLFGLRFSKPTRRSRQSVEIRSSDGI